MLFNKYLFIQEIVKFPCIFVGVCLLASRMVARVPFYLNCNVSYGGLHVWITSDCMLFSSLIYGMLRQNRFVVLYHCWPLRKCYADIRTIIYIITILTVCYYTVSVRPPCMYGTSLKVITVFSYTSTFYSVLTKH